SHEGRVQNIDGGNCARAAIGATPGLHRGKGRYNEQATRDRETAQVDRGTQPETRRQHNGGTLWRGRRNCAKSGKAEIERKRAQQNGTRECWTENDASPREWPRPTGADPHRDREQGEIGGDGFLVSTDQRFDQWR